MTKRKGSVGETKSQIEYDKAILDPEFQAKNVAQAVLFVKALEDKNDAAALDDVIYKAKRMLDRKMITQAEHDNIVNHIRRT